MKAYLTIFILIVSVFVGCGKEDNQQVEVGSGLYGSAIVKSESRIASVGVAGNDDAILVVMNSSGGYLWEKTIGGSQRDLPWCVVSTGDDGYAIAGATYSYGPGVTANSNMWIAKINENAMQMWAGIFGWNGNDAATGIYQRENTNFVVGGFADSSGNTDGVLLEFSVTKVDTGWTGITFTIEEKWHKFYGGTNNDWFNSLIKVADGFLLAGGTRSLGAGGADIWLVKTDDNGNLLWQKTIGDEQDQWALGIAPASDGYVIAGITSSNYDDCSTWDGYVAKVNTAGDLQWSATFGDSTGRDAFDAALCVPDGIVLTGTAYKPPLNKLWVKKIASNGEPVWETFYGNYQHCEGKGIVSVDDGYWVTGYVSYEGVSGMIIMKFFGADSVSFPRLYGLAPGI